MMREQFGQAVTGDDPKVLENFSRPAINLVIWKNALSEESKKYFADVPLGEYLKNIKWYEHVGKRIGEAGKKDEESVRNNMMSALPSRPGQDAAVQDIVKLLSLYAQIINSSAFWAEMFVFMPMAPYWHADKGKSHGNITLAGATGMIWRPDDTLSVPPEKAVVKEHGSCRWDSVDSRDPAIQVIDAFDFSIFKCWPASPHPLAHATPTVALSPKPRLALLMGE